jgi:hypothetical protein
LSVRHGSTGQEIKDVPDRQFAGRGFREREVRLDLVAIPPAVFRLYEVARFGQVGHDSVGSALGNAEACRDVANAHIGVVGNAEQRSSMVGEEIPSRHDLIKLIEICFRD